MRAALALLALSGIGCGYGAVSVDGSFGPERFEPTGTVFAVVDAHVEVDDPTGGIRVEERAVKTVVVFLCQAALDPDVDWAGLPGREILGLQETVRRGDRVLVRDLALTQLEPGARLEASAQRADFGFVALPGTEPVGADDSYAQVRPLGRVVKAAFVVEEAELREGGHLRASLTLARERAGDQPANTATGQVTLTFDAPILGERIGESNLSILDL
ncbi:MAG: hypothetical protein ABIJ09_24990 [Pseudomonadota bacterium]